MTPEREAVMSLHEETCSDATKLAREIHEDVMGGVEEIARAIQAGFDYREARLCSSLATAEHQEANLHAHLEAVQSRWGELSERLAAAESRAASLEELLREAIQIIDILSPSERFQKAIDFLNKED